jgi:uncharacterized protein (TIGR02996 family)
VGDESGFLKALQSDLHDDVSRLVYADWLEERGDVRGEYLRLQCELKRAWSYADPCRELFRRAASLRQRINPHWLSLVHRCTTPAPPTNVAEAIPALAAKARRTVCLHPRPGAAAVDASKIGGHFLWPAAEEWPSCPDHNCPLVGALQLRKEDIPEVGFKRGTDLFQLLWCPHDHEPGYCPAPEVYWWRRDAITTAGSHPAPSSAEQWYVPKPCLLYPERVVEYPDPFELDHDIDEQIQESSEFERALELVQKMSVGQWSLPDDTEQLYQCWLSTADGTKVGGYPDWVQDSEYPSCSCGKTMELLVMFSSWEFDGGTWGRWVPIEERDVLDANSGQREVVHSAAGWMFGDAGNMYVFSCRSCESRPIRYLMQCS